MKHELYHSFQFEQYADKLKKANSYNDSLRNLDLVNIELETVDFFISELNGVKNEEIKEIENLDQQLAQQMIKVADWIGTFGTNEALKQKEELTILCNDQSKLSELSTAMMPVFKVLIDVTYIELTLYFFAILTIQHSSRTRYIVDDKSPKDIYTNEHAVIKKLPELSTLLNEALWRMVNLNP